VRYVAEVPVKRLDHCVIAVSSWEAATDFYRDVLGAEVVEIDSGRVSFRIGDTQLNVHGPGFMPTDNVARLPVQPGNSDLCFVWDGTVEEANKRLLPRSRRQPARTDRVRLTTARAKSLPSRSPTVASETSESAWDSGESTNLSARGCHDHRCGFERGGERKVLRKVAGDRSAKRLILAAGNGEVMRPAEAGSDGAPQLRPVAEQRVRNLRECSLRLRIWAQRDRPG
jgi:catechol 2,3-dioxygenase-like lactoylglutathione lyase family enzyme